MSATIGHLLVTQGSRFVFSREFSHLLLSQLEDLLDGNEVTCRFKRGGKDNNGKDTWWPDCFAHDYKWRPLELRSSVKVFTTASMRIVVTRVFERAIQKRQHLTYCFTKGCLS